MYSFARLNKSMFLRNSSLLKYSHRCNHSILCKDKITAKTHCRLLYRHNLSLEYIYRNIHVTSRLQYDEPLKPSSKIEETVQALKEKAKEKEKQKTTGKDVSASKATEPPVVPIIKVEPTTSQVSEDSKPLEVVPVKKTLGQRIWAEVLHYYHGFRLLGLDIKLSAALAWRILNGKQLTRREHNLLIRTVGDIFRLIPFSVFIIVPFMELLLPVFIKFFPGMLPSQFATAKEKEDKMKQSLKVKLEMAKFLQKTLDNMGVSAKGRSSESAKEFSEFYEKVRSKGVDTSTEDIMKFSRLFQDEITLDSLSRPQLQALCRVLELHPIGTSNFLRFQLRLKLRSLAADDKMIQREGVGLLTLEELQNACRSRGMRAFGVPKDRLQTQLKQWLDLSLNEKVPPSLLLLSRAFMLPETINTTEILKATISELPQTVAVSTQAALDEREGKIDNKTKIMVLKEEERKIKEEKAEYLEEKKRLEMEKKLKEQEEEEKRKEELITDKADVIIDKAVVYENVVASPKDTTKAKESKKDEDEEMVAAADLQVVEDALDEIGKNKKELLVEKHELADLKEEMSDYQEDVKDLEVLQSQEIESKEALKESKAAKRLFKSVNKMIKNMDKVIEDLSQKEKAIKEDISAKQKEDKAVNSDVSEELVKIDELIGVLRQIQQVSDSSKLQRIAEVLERMDVDHDGSVRIEAVLKVLELIGHENVKLSTKQFEEIVKMIDKEEVIELEEQLDKAFKTRLEAAAKSDETVTSDQQTKTVGGKSIENTKLSESESTSTNPNNTIPKPKFEQDVSKITPPIPPTGLTDSKKSEEQKNV